MLQPIVLTDLGIDRLDGFVKAAVSSLDSMASLGGTSIQRQLYEQLYYDVLYRIPNVDQQIRFESLEEILSTIRNLNVTREKVLALEATLYHEWTSVDMTYSDKALNVYHQALLLEPKNSYLWSRIADLSNGIARPLDAYCYWDQYLKYSSSEAGKLNMAGVIESLDQETQDLIVQKSAVSPSSLRSEVAGSDDVRSISEYLHLADILQADRKYDEALAYVDRVLNSKIASAAEIGAGMLLQGAIFRAQSRFADAAIVFRAFLDLAREQRFPADNYRHGNMALASVLHSLGDHAGAAAAYRTALDAAALPSQRAEVLALFGRESKEAGLYETAAIAFEQAYEFYRTMSTKYTRHDIQRALLTSLDEYSAIASPQIALKIDEAIVEGLTNIISDIEESASHDFDGCTWVAEHFYQNEPDPYSYLNTESRVPIISSGLYHGRREALERLHRFEEAQRDLEKETKQLKRNPVTAADYYSLGNALFRAGYYTETINAMQQAIDLDRPGVTDDTADATDYYVMGMSYVHLKEDRKAVQYLYMAADIERISKSSQAALFYAELAAAYARLQMYDKAVNAQREASKYRLNVEHDEIVRDWWRLADIYERWAKESQDIQHYQSAIDAYEQLLSVLPGDPHTEANPSLRERTWLKIAQISLMLGISTQDMSWIPTSTNAFEKSLVTHEYWSAWVAYFSDNGFVKALLANYDDQAYEETIHAFQERYVWATPQISNMGLTNSSPEFVAGRCILAELYFAWGESKRMGGREWQEEIQESWHILNDTIQLQTALQSDGSAWADISQQLRTVVADKLIREASAANLGLSSDYTEAYTTIADSAVEFYDLGRILYVQRNYTETIAAMQKAIDLDNVELKYDVHDATDYYYQGVSYRALDRYIEAAEKLALAASLEETAGDPQLTAMFYRELGNVYIEMEDYESAVHAIEKALQYRRRDDTYAVLADWMALSDVYTNWFEVNGDTELQKKAQYALEQANKLK
jgi:tetratricopeptide (TPR) repeat protein